jgi:hypothetical protein
MKLHDNAALSLNGRRRLVRMVIDATAARVGGRAANSPYRLSFED